MATARNLPVAKGAASVNPALVIGQVLALVKDVAETLATEGTERERTSADLARDLERIRATEAIVLGHLNGAFAERREAFTRLFDALDAAIAAENPQMAAGILDGIVTTLGRSPLADLAAVRAKLGDPGAEWRL